MPADLRALLRKYDLLLALIAGPAGRTLARRDAMREIAAQFPGALREWDALPPAEIARRREVVARALEGGRGEAGATGPESEEPWLRYARSLHGHLRGLLQVRRVLRAELAESASGDDRGDEGGLLDRCQALYEAAGGPLSLRPEHLQHLRAPPGGRLSAVAYADLAARHGVSAEQVRAALFVPLTPTTSERRRIDDGHGEAER